MILQRLLRLKWSLDGTLIAPVRFTAPVRGAVPLLASALRRCERRHQRGCPRAGRDRNERQEDEGRALGLEQEAQDPRGSPLGDGVAGPLRRSGRRARGGVGRERFAAFAGRAARTQRTDAPLQAPLELSWEAGAGASSGDDEVR